MPEGTMQDPIRVKALRAQGWAALDVVWPANMREYIDSALLDAIIADVNSGQWFTLTFDPDGRVFQYLKEGRKHMLRSPSERFPRVMRDEESEPVSKTIWQSLDEMAHPLRTFRRELDEKLWKPLDRLGDL